MSTLDIHQSSNDPFIVTGIKKSLQKKFKLTSYKEVDKAVMLANYLLCLDRSSEAAGLLDSFILGISYDEDREDLWGAVGQGIILRAYILSFEKNDKKRKNLMSLIESNDIMTDRANRYNLYIECLEDHVDNIERAATETQKYKCEIWSQEALTFLYFYEMLPFYKNEAPDNLEADLKALIEKCYTELRTALIGEK